MSYKRVISVGAHSLDAELLGGPLLIKYAKKGAHVTCINMTQGRLEDPSATEEEKKAYLDKVTEEGKKAAEFLGGDSMWFGCVGSNMPTTDELAKRLEEYFEKEKADLVITHWRGSMHPRHVNTHDAVTTAIKNMHRKGSNIKLLYGETFEDLVGYMPQRYIELEDDEVETWFKALRSYTVFSGKVNGFPYEKYYSTNLQIRQIEAGTNKPTVCYMHASYIQNKLWGE